MHAQPSLVGHKWLWICDRFRALVATVAPALGMEDVPPDTISSGGPPHTLFGMGVSMKKYCPADLPGKIVKSNATGLPNRSLGQ